MTTSSNPYLNRTALLDEESFVGRRRELDTIFSRIGASTPQSVSVVGDRRIGKSSLLRAIQRRKEKALLQGEKYIFVFRDLQEAIHTDVTQFFSTILEDVALQLHDHTVAQMDPSYDSIRRVVASLDAKKMKLILLLDEFDAVTLNPNFDFEFFSFLRSLPNNYRVSFIVTSSRELQQLCHSKEISGSPFFNIFHKLNLGPFNEEEARELIALPSKDYGYPLEPYSPVIFRMAGFFPFFLQLACCAMFDGFREDEGRKGLNLDLVWDTFCQEAHDHFDYAWDHFSDREKSLCWKVRDRQSLDESDLRFLSNLIRRGYVQKTDGQPALFSDAFSSFLTIKRDAETGGAALNAAEVYEMESARQVQSHLFPQHIPSLDTLECAARCMQAQQVGGDYFDFLDILPPRQVGLVLADIVGKGVSAALLMAHLQATLRSQCALAAADPVGLLQEVNRLFCQCTATNRYATMFLGIYDDGSRSLRYANCGHNPPIIVRAEGSIEFLNATGTVLGMFEDWKCEMGVRVLEPGDTLIVFSDGITEALSPQGEEFGESRLVQEIKKQNHLSPNDLLTAIIKRVQNFSAGVQSDDLTILVARGR